MTVRKICIFLKVGHFWAQKCKNSKISQNLLIRFFQNLCDGKLSNGSKSVFLGVFLSFSRKLWLCPNNPSFDSFGYNIYVFHNSCILTLFFSIVLVLEGGSIFTSHSFSDNYQSFIGLFIFSAVVMAAKKGRRNSIL